LLPHTADAAALARSALLRDAAAAAGGSASSHAANVVPAAAAAVAAAAAAVVATSDLSGVSSAKTSASSSTKAITAGGTSPPADGPGSGTRPFVRLRPTTGLFFERALDEARKRLDTSLGVYPYDLLSKDERMMVLAKVAVALAGYGTCEANAITESALFNIFACARERVEAEADAAVAAAASEANEAAAAASGAGPSSGGPGKAITAASGPPVAAPSAKSGEVWRLLLAGAFTEEWGTDRVSTYELMGGGGGSPLRPEVWGTLVDMVAERALFGRDAYGIKKALFLERDPVQQRLLFSQLLMGPTPSTADATLTLVDTVTLALSSPGPCLLDAQGDRLKWFPPRPPPASDAELGEAERQVAALTPKGRELLHGLFPADHFASKMTMRQLVFSVEGACSSYCSCDSCVRCRNAVERLHRQHGAAANAPGGAKGNSGSIFPFPALPAPAAPDKGNKGSADGKWAAGGAQPGRVAIPGGDAALAFLPANSPPAAVVAAAAAAAVAAGGVPSEGGSLGPRAWAAVGESSKDMVKFWSSLTSQQRRDMLLVPACDLDRSMAMSRDWDILASAELSYNYGGGKGALVEYDSGKDCFLPGPLLADPTKGLASLLGALRPGSSADLAHWKDSPKEQPPAAAAASGAKAGAAGDTAPVKGPLAEYSRQLLELHFVRLFAVKLLVRFGDAARASAAQEVLEALLREEESAAQRTASKAARKKEKEKAKAKEREAAAAAARAAAAAEEEEKERLAAEQEAEAAKKAAAQRKAHEEAERKQELVYEAMRQEAQARQAEAERAAAAAAAEEAAAGSSKSRRKRGGKKAGAEAKGNGDGDAPPPPPLPVPVPVPVPAASRAPEVESEADMLARAIRESLADEAVRKAKADVNALASAPAMRPPKARPTPVPAPLPLPSGGGGGGGVTVQQPPTMQQQQRIPQPVLGPSALPPSQAVPQALPGLMSRPLMAPSPPQQAFPRSAQPGGASPLSFPTGAASAPSAPQYRALLQHPVGGASGGASGIGSAQWGTSLGTGWGAVSSQSPLSASPASSTTWSNGTPGGAPSDELARLRLSHEAAVGSATRIGGGSPGSGSMRFGAMSPTPLQLQQQAQQQQQQPQYFGALKSTDLSVSAPAFNPSTLGSSGGLQAFGALDTADGGLQGSQRSDPPPGFYRHVSSGSAPGSAVQRKQAVAEPEPPLPTVAALNAAFAALVSPRGLNDPQLPFTSGVMFVCTKFTQEECFRRRLLGLPRRDLDLVAACQPGRTALFLFNFTTRELHGVFVASSPGRLNLDGDAWKRSLYHRPGSARAGAGTSPFPSQVKFAIVREFSPLHEDRFSHLFRGTNRVASLSGAQVRDLIRLFVQYDTLKATPNPGALSREPMDHHGDGGGDAGMRRGGGGAFVGSGELAAGGRNGDSGLGFGGRHSGAFGLMSSRPAGGASSGGLGHDSFRGSGASYDADGLSGGGALDDDGADALDAAAAAAASVEMLFEDDLLSGMQADGGGDDDGVCAICFEQPQDVQLLPCGHNSFCYTCVADLQRCPLCRAAVLRVEALP
jgi:hypothetical protein